MEWFLYMMSSCMFLKINQCPVERTITHFYCSQTGKLVLYCRAEQKLKNKSNWRESCKGGV